MPDRVQPYPARLQITQLCTAEIFLVMLIRLRAAADIDPASMPEEWCADMATANISTEGVTAFDRLMYLLGTELHLPLDIRRLHCGSLGGGETLLLQATSLLQHNRYADAKTVLSHWLPQASLPLAMKYMQSLANALAAVHLAIPLRPSEPNHSVLAATTQSIAQMLFTYQDQIFALEIAKARNRKIRRGGTAIC
jgi:hypothetical protein